MLHKKLLHVFLVPTSLSSHLKLRKKNPRDLDLKPFLEKTVLLKTTPNLKNNPK
jgi:hypothetical protein